MTSPVLCGKIGAYVYDIYSFQNNYAYYYLNCFKTSLALEMSIDQMTERLLKIKEDVDEVLK